MDITIIGSGNVAAVLGRLSRKKGHTIVEIAGRNKLASASLAQELNAATCNDISNLNKISDIYIITVNDDAIAEVASGLRVDEKIVVHTCGSVSKEILKNSSKNYGILYPLQSLRKETDYTPSIPFLIDGNNTHSTATIQNLSTSISSGRITEADDAMRLRYHIAAVVVSNFTNHLFTLTKQYCDANKIDFNLLLPLIEELVNRLHSYEPSAMQTGPAARGDKATVQKHIAMLEEFPQLKYIYEIMSKSISEFNG